jgi:hypothetical protein
MLPTPLLYYDRAQKSPLFVSGAIVGESPHGSEGSCIGTYTYCPKSIQYDIHGTGTPSLNMGGVGTSAVTSDWLL